MNDSECRCDIPAHILQKADAAARDLLPKVSRIRYENACEKFSPWLKGEKICFFSEPVMLTYFSAVMGNPPTSKLGIRKSLVFTRVFTPQQLRKFPDEKSDQIHLLNKVVVVLGLSDACRGLTSVRDNT